MQPRCLEVVSQVCLNGCCPSPILGFSEPLNKTSKPRNTSATCRQNFAKTTTSSIFPNTHFTNPESLPSLQESFDGFIKVYPQYSETYQVDQTRAQEYNHLAISNHTCLDYIGIGLFSYAQLQKHGLDKQILPSASSPPPPPQNTQNMHVPFFSLSYKTGNLKTQPFKTSRKLLTVYDYESEAVEAMINSSEKKGAQVMSAEFSWPGLRIQSSKLKKMVEMKSKRKKMKRGLFVFPLHSRMTGARYPYLWMNRAKENEWHILIDACALGPKDMDSFGLSLIRPDFLICSFYKIFGENPSGFGCLFVKKSTVPILEDSLGSGMVNLVLAKKPLRLLDEFSGTDSDFEHLSKLGLQEDELDSSNSFSGPISSQATQSGRVEQGETSESQTTGVNG